MSNQIDANVARLSRLLAGARLTKVAADQDIEHLEPTDQTDLGKEQTQEIKDNIEGVIASTPAAANKPSDTVEELPNCQSLNRDASAAMAATGTSVNVMDQDGDAASLPKSASFYTRKLASLMHQMDKKAMLQKQAAEDFRTGTEVMEKFASLGDNPSEEDLAEAHNELCKLASTNPVFQACRDRILMQKLAEDVDALAEAEGISPEEAAAALDEAAAADPSIMEEAEDEANGEAVADLADAEGEADAIMGGVQQLADGASEVLGTEVTADDILSAIDEVEAQAEELGVPPEALIQAAMEEMQGAAAEDEVTPEDEANAEAILEEAANNGISPEEVIQMAADELGGVPNEGSEMAEEAPTEEAPAEEGEVKEASVHTAATPRAAYVQSLMHR